MLTVLLGLLAVITVVFTVVYVSDYRKNRDAEKSYMFNKGLVIGFLTYHQASQVGS